MSTQNQHKETRNTQSGTREGSHLRSAGLSASVQLRSILLLLLLLPHQNVSEMQRKQVGSLTLGALTLSLALSPHAATPAPRPQEIPHLHRHPRLLSSSAASCFRGDGLVHQQQGSAWLSKQVRARWLPKTDRCDPWFLSSSLGAPPSDLLHFLRVRSAGLETKR